MSGMRRSMITTSGRRLSVERDRGRAVARLADHAHLRRAREREPKALADDLVVVGDQAGDLFGHGSILRGASGGSFLRMSNGQSQLLGSPARERALRGGVACGAAAARRRGRRASSFTGA